MASNKIIAHRGLPSEAPENTMAAFEAARLAGASWLETDVGITSDGRIVILHDDYLDRTTSLTGALAESTWSDVHQASAGSWYSPEFKDEKVPSLETFIAFVNKHKMNVNFELKSVIGSRANELADVLVEKFAALLKTLDPDINIIVSSFNPLMLMKLRDIDPTVRLAVLFETHTLYEDWILIMQALDAHIIHPQSEGLTKAQVLEMKSYHYEVNVWTVDERDRANELFNWGVDGVFTDRFPILAKSKKGDDHDE